MAAASEVLGVLLAGGESRRFGSPKGRATVGGRSLVARGLSALDEAADDTVVVSNRPGSLPSTDREVRPDVRPGTGALGGILTAVRWADDRGRSAAVVLACDMPFVPGALLARLRRDADPSRVVVPESGGPRGIEPLCGVYGIDCVAAIEDALDRGERAIVSFYAAVDVLRLPVAEVRAFGPPERLFFNVNRPEERDRAERIEQAVRELPNEEAE